MLKLLGRVGIGAFGVVGKYAEQIAVAGLAVILDDEYIVALGTLYDKAVNGVEARVIKGLLGAELHKILRRGVVGTVATVRAEFISLGVVLGKNRRRPSDDILLVGGVVEDLGSPHVVRRLA